MAMTMRLYTDAGSRREADERPCCLCCASLAGACAYESVHRSRRRRPVHSNHFRRRRCLGKHSAYAEAIVQPVIAHAPGTQSWQSVVHSSALDAQAAVCMQNSKPQRPGCNKLRGWRLHC